MTEYSNNKINNTEKNLLYYLSYDSSDFFPSNYIAWFEDERGNLLNFLGDRKLVYIRANKISNIPFPKSSIKSIKYFGQTLNMRVPSYMKIENSFSINFESDANLDLYTRVLRILNVNPGSYNYAKFGESTVERGKVNLLVSLWSKSPATKNKIKDGYNFSNISEYSDLKKAIIPIIKFENIKIKSISAIELNNESSNKIEHTVEFGFRSHSLSYCNAPIS